METKSRKERVTGFAAWFVVTFIASGIGATASVRAQSFYSGLIQPEWAPSASVFGPVWTILYALMAWAAWLVWRSGGFQSNRLPLTLYLAQLIPNALWSWLFFAWSQGVLALVDIVFLWLLVLVTLCAFWRVRPLAGALLIPYLLWVSFATALNYSVWQLNPQILG